MSRTLVHVAAVAAMVAAAPAGATSAAATMLAPEAQDAAAVVDAFHGALRRGDTAVALALLADDASIFEAGAAERSKAEYAAHHLAADAEFARQVPESVARRTGAAAGDFAWIASEGRTAGSYKGKPLDRATTETMLLRRTGPDWKIVHIHWSSAARRAR